MEILPFSLLYRLLHIISRKWQFLDPHSKIELVSSTISQVTVDFCGFKRVFILTTNADGFCFSFSPKSKGYLPKPHGLEHVQLFCQWHPGFTHMIGRGWGVGEAFFLPHLPQMLSLPLCLLYRFPCALSPILNLWWYFPSKIIKEIMISFCYIKIHLAHTNL